MAKVHATQMGTRIRIGNFGEAVLEETRDAEGKVTGVRDEGVEVPEDVARQFEEEIRGERPNPDHGKEGHEGEPAVLKIGRGPNTQLRVERAAPAPRTTKKTPEKGGKE